MTAEIGVINRRGVALAADSAVTITKPDNSIITMNNAEKLFSLYSSNYIGIMIYQNANFMGLPWEVLINSFKEYVGNQVRPHVKDYVADFLTYINSLDIYNNQNEINFVAKNAYSVLSILSANGGSIDEVENTLYSIEVNAKKKVILKVDLEEFAQKYYQDLEVVFHQVYGSEFDELIELFVRVVGEVIASAFFVDEQYSTGLVIAGYGSEDLFPSIYQLTIAGRYANQIKYQVETQETTDPITGEINSGIYPFAQREMVDTVVQGIDLDLQNELAEKFNNISKNTDQYIDQHFEANEQIKELKDYLATAIARQHNEFIKVVRAQYREPILSMLDNLSLDELGQMAETFVNLTSFKRKYSGSIRTVGGPVDVLIVSREDGAVWLNNKKKNKLFK